MSATATLCVHRGAERVSLEALREYKTPSAIGRWFPISHAKVVDVATEKLEDAGYKIKKADYGVYKDGSRFFGTLELDSIVADGVGLAVGLRNSVDKSMRVGMCAGSKVFVCDNMSFSSEINVHRKHTRHAMRDLIYGVEDGVAKLDSFKKAEASRIDLMKNAELTNDQAHALILRSNLAKLIPHTMLGDVAAQWEKPACDWGGTTAWRLFNAFTYCMKEAAERNADTHAGRTMKLGALLLRASV